MGVCTAAVALQGENCPSIPLKFKVTKVPQLNLLGLDAIVRLGINVSALMGLPVDTTSSVHPISHVLNPDINLHRVPASSCARNSLTCSSQSCSLRTYNWKSDSNWIPMAQGLLGVCGSPCPIQ